MPCNQAILHFISHHHPSSLSCLALSCRSHVPSSLLLTDLVAFFVVGNPFTPILCACACARNPALRLPKPTPPRPRLSNPPNPCAAMVPEEIYEICLPILENGSTEEEEKVEKLEQLLRQKASLLGSSLENAILDVLWRHRSSTKPDTSPPLRHTVIRRASPAPWQIPRASTPLSPPSNSGTSPAGPPGFPVPRGGFPRAPRSLTASPFTSPRPSPRLALAQPIPHSPSLSTYEFSDPTSGPEIYGDYGSDNVDWLVNDDARSAASSTGLSGAAPEWVAPPDMSPYDILRSVLGDRRTNEEIEHALEANGYDLGATIAALTDQENENAVAVAASNEARILVGKSMAMDQMRPVTPSGQARSPVVCKYWLSTGQCLRADCRFSHDLTSHVCK